MIDLRDKGTSWRLEGIFWNESKTAHVPAGNVIFRKKTPPWYGLSLGPIMVACHLNMLSPMGPALQFGGGSRLSDCNSLFSLLRAIYTRWVLCARGCYLGRQDSSISLHLLELYMFFVSWSHRQMGWEEAHVLPNSRDFVSDPFYRMFHERVGMGIVWFLSCGSIHRRWRWFVVIGFVDSPLCTPELCSHLVFCSCSFIFPFHFHCVSSPLTS